MRSLAALFAAADPGIAALSEIDAGDALAMATRFDREWAYRGGQALLWKRNVTAHAVHDLYLPMSALRPFDRRGLLRLDAEAEGVPLHVFATQFAADRAAIRDLRFARAAVRGVDGNVLLFIAEPGPSRIGFAGTGLRSVAPAPSMAIWARGFHLDLQGYSESEPGLSSIAIARATKV
jgi:hypothetical protein